MALSGLARRKAKPAGGISKVELIAAADFTGALFDDANGCFASVDTAVPFAVWSLREDRASYTETSSAISGAPMVAHTLKMELPAGPETRRAVEELSQTGGVVAIITTREGERLLAGYSPRFGTAYPLRLTDARSDAGESPADLPTETVVLSSLDADRSLPLG